MPDGALGWRGVGGEGKSPGPTTVCPGVGGGMQWSLFCCAGAQGVQGSGSNGSRAGPWPVLQQGPQGSLGPDFQHHGQSRRPGQVPAECGWGIQPGSALPGLLWVPPQYDSRWFG